MGNLAKEAVSTLFLSYVILPILKLKASQIVLSFQTACNSCFVFEHHNETCSPCTKLEIARMKHITRVPHYMSFVAFSRPLQEIGLQMSCWSAFALLIGQLRHAKVHAFYCKRLFKLLLSYMLFCHISLHSIKHVQVCKLSFFTLDTR